MNKPVAVQVLIDAYLILIWPDSPFKTQVSLRPGSAFFSFYRTQSWHGHILSTFYGEHYVSFKIYFKKSNEKILEYNNCVKKLKT
jgi:hypothetical protein